MVEPLATRRGLGGGQLPRRTGFRLLLALLLTIGLVVAEALAGVFANSLALLTDAAHNFTDVIALGLSWHAVQLTTKPSSSRKTYGYHRAGILVALVNSATLGAIAFGVLLQAYERFVLPPAVNSGVLIEVGLVAIAVNLLTALLVRRSSDSDLNVRSAFVHLLGDVASSIGAVIAGVIIHFTGWNWLDPLVSVLIGLLILYTAWGILREAVEILLEATPRDVDMRAMVSDIRRVDGVLGVHDLHVWSLTKNLRTMSAHILTEDIPISAGAQIQSEVDALVAERYHILHATLQLECVRCEPDSLFCDVEGVVPPPRTT
jgi:cobalt-zinc-cadmium efflux system protein